MTKILARAADADGPVASECEVRIKEGVADLDEDGAIAMPESLRIGPFDYTVVEKPELECEKSGNIGHLDSGAFEIGVALHVPPQRQAEVMLHEVFHGVFRGFGFDLDHDLEEKLVTLLAQGMLQVMRDNPEMIAWIYDRIGLKP